MNKKVVAGLLTLIEHNFQTLREYVETEEKKLPTVIKKRTKRAYKKRAKVTAKD